MKMKLEKIMNTELINKVIRPRLGLCLVLALLQIFIYMIPAPVMAEDVSKDSSKIIAVSDFTNDTGDNALDYLRKGLANAIITKLAAYSNLTLVERGRLEAVLKELGLGDSGVVDANTAAKVGNALGANAIIVGGLFKAGSKLRLNVRVIDVTTIKVLQAVSEDGSSQEEILTLIDKVSERVARSFTGEKVFPTSVPTLEPTPVPTVVPTPVPTPVPTVVPTPVASVAPKNEGFPLWGWIAIGTGAAILIGAGIYFATGGFGTGPNTRPTSGLLPNPTSPRPTALPLFISPDGIGLSIGF